MYYVYIENDRTYSPKLSGEFEDLEEARKHAKQESESDSSVTYTIEESSGGFNSYGELLTTTIEKG